MLYLDNATGYIDHVYKQRNIRLHGRILSLNEADQTCRMVFDNGIVEDGIPMEAVELDESFLTGVKAGAKRILNSIGSTFRKIGGYLCHFIDGFLSPEVTEVAAYQYINKEKPEFLVCAVPGKNTRSFANENGINISSVMNDEEDDPEFLADCNKFWEDVIKIYKKDRRKAGVSESVAPTMPSIKRAYIKACAKRFGINAARRLNESKGLNAFFGLNKLNEANNKINIKEPEFKVSVPKKQDDLTKIGLHGERRENVMEVDQKYIFYKIYTQLSLANQVNEFDPKRFGHALYKAIYLKFCNPDGLDTGFDDDEMIDQASAFVSKSIKNKALTTELKNYIKSFKGTYMSAGSVLDTKPLMIWGAPGIGKTQIVHQCIDFFSKSNKGINPNMIDCNLALMTRDDFQLPVPNIDLGRSDNLIQSWMPVFHFDPTDPEQNEIENDRVNRSKWNSPKNLPNGVNFDKVPGKKAASKKDLNDDNALLKMLAAGDIEDINDMAENTMHNKLMRINGDSDKEYTGGILFFDEFPRADKDVMSILMNLINDRTIGNNYYLGTKWIITLAGNRPYESVADFNWEMPWGSRMEQVTFVPQFSDWLKWAKGYELQVNNRKIEWSAEPVKAPKINKWIIDYLESAGEVAWYEGSKLALGDDEVNPMTMANPRAWETFSKAIDQAARTSYSADDFIDYDDPTYTRLDPADFSKYGHGIIGIDQTERLKEWADFGKMFTIDNVMNIWNYGQVVPSKKEISIADKLNYLFSFSAKTKPQYNLAVPYEIKVKFGSVSNAFVDNKSVETVMSAASNFFTHAAFMKVRDRFLFIDNETFKINDVNAISNSLTDFEKYLLNLLMWICYYDSGTVYIKFKSAWNKFFNSYLNAKGTKNQKEFLNGSIINFSDLPFVRSMKGIFNVLDAILGKETIKTTSATFGELYQNLYNIGKIQKDTVKL